MRAERKACPRDARLIVRLARTHRGELVWGLRHPGSWRVLATSLDLSEAHELAAADAGAETTTEPPMQPIETGRAHDAYLTLGIALVVVVMVSIVHAQRTTPVQRVCTSYLPCSEVRS